LLSVLGGKRLLNFILIMKLEEYCNELTLIRSFRYVVILRIYAHYGFVYMIGESFFASFMWQLHYNKAKKHGISNEACVGLLI
jgi:hypothetical protein